MITLPRFYPDGYAYTGPWADRPSPAGIAGALARITDAGRYGSDWISDGSAWRPLNGHLVLAAGATNLTTTATNPTLFGGSPSITIPGGMLLPGMQLRGMARAVRSAGGSSGSALIGMSLSGGPNIQSPIICSAGTSSTATVVIQAMGALVVASPTTVRSATNWGVSWSGSSTAATANLTTLDLSVDRTVQMFGMELVGGTGLSLIDYSIELIDGGAP